VRRARQAVYAFLECELSSEPVMIKNGEVGERVSVREGGGGMKKWWVKR